MEDLNTKIFERRPLSRARYTSGKLTKLLQRYEGNCFQLINQKMDAVWFDFIWLGIFFSFFYGFLYWVNFSSQMVKNISWEKNTKYTDIDILILGAFPKVLIAGVQKFHHISTFWGLIFLTWFFLQYPPSFPFCRFWKANS